MIARRRRWWWPIGRALLCALGASATLWAGLGAASVAQAQTPRAVSVTRHRPVVLILAEALDWADAPADLGSFAHGSLSLHSAGSALSDADGFLTVGKGRRAVGLTTLTTLPRPDTAGTTTVPDWSHVMTHDAHTHYGGKLGAFGDALRASGRRWELVTNDPLAGLAVVDSHGVIRNDRPGGAPQVAAAVRAGVDVVVIVAQTPTELPGLVAAAADRCTVVASVSSPPGFTHLGVFATSPSCRLGQGGLVSSSTRQAPFLALIDVAPTVLDRGGLARATTMIGQPARAAGHVTTRALAAEDLRAHRTLAAHDGFTWFFIIGSSLVAALVLFRRRPPLGIVAWAAALPVSSFLMMTVPWWNHGAWAADVVCGLIAAVIAVLCVLATRARPELCLEAVAAVTVIVLVGDAVRGGTLELDAPFGNSPTIAGRFDGIGNIAFGFAMGATLLGCAVALHRRRDDAFPWVVLVCIAFAAAGAPALGDKVGLVPVWIPAAGVLLSSARSGRVRVRWLLICGAVALVAFGLFAAYDLTRGATSQSHLARWLSSGDTLDTVNRKVTSMLRSFRGEPLRWLLPLPLLVLFGQRRTLLGTTWLRSLVLALATAAVLGSLLEDSGIAVGVAVLAASWPGLS